MKLSGEALVKVQANVATCREAGLTDDEITKRLESAGFNQDVINQLIVKPAKEKKEAQDEAEQSLLDLVDSLAVFLDGAMPKLWDGHSLQQYKYLVDLKNYHNRLMEALNASARANGQPEVYGTDGKVNYRLGQ